MSRLGGEPEHRRHCRPPVRALKGQVALCQGRQQRLAVGVRERVAKHDRRAGYNPDSNHGYKYTLIHDAIIHKERRLGRQPKHLGPGHRRVKG